MRADLYTTGFGGAKFDDLLRAQAKRSDVSHLHAAVAYVSVRGLAKLTSVCEGGNLNSVRLLTDIRDYVTHPMAILKAKEVGWNVRVSKRKYTFHSKIFVFSSAKDPASDSGPKSLLIGSNNISDGGMRNNHESGVLLRDIGALQAGTFFSKIWALGSPITSKQLADYEERFKYVNKRRTKETFEALGLEVEKENKSEYAATSRQKASSVWCGLETFTGEYDLQVEYPKAVGDILSSLVPTSPDNKVDFLCDDGEIRSMTFKYYDSNSMWRLNIQNDVPMVQAIRNDPRGIALVEATKGAATLQLRIIRDAKKIDDIKSVSAAVGQLGETSTRFYGWF